MKNGIQEIIKSKKCPGIIGTRDGFGIGTEFRDEETGKTVDNYRTWEKLGYSQAKDNTIKDKRGNIKDKVMAKREKLKWKQRRGWHE